MSQIDFDAIRAQFRVSETVGKYVKLSRDGREFKGCCPFHNERSPSFYVNDDKQFYHCFGCGAHGDVIDFVQAYHNTTLRAAAEILTGSEPVPAGERAKRESVAIDYYSGMTACPAPHGALWKPNARTPEIFNPKRADDPKRRMVRYTPTMVFPYLSGEGELLGYVLRVEYAREGETPVKITPTIRYATLPDGTSGWTHWHFDEPRTLYGLDLLAKAAPTAQVFICEGEKAADACARLLGVVALTWPGGTNAVDKADWSPLAGRKVVIWPDADAPGWKAAVGDTDKKTGVHTKGIAELLHGIAAEIKVIDTRDHETKGWDIADAEKDGWTKAQALAWGKERIAVWTPPAASVVNEAIYGDKSDAPAIGFAALSPEEREKFSAGQPLSDDVLTPPPISDDYINQMLDQGRHDDRHDEQATESPDKWQPFKMLGFNKGSYYYMPKGTQQLVELTASAHTQTNLMQIAPLDYWETQYPKKGGVDLNMAVNALFQRSAAIGIFIPDRVRGRGAWMDQGRAVVHLGPMVQIGGENRRPSEIESEYIYEAAPAMQITPDVPATNEEANRLVRICERLTWENPLSAQLLAGWCVIAPVCGALDWRSHIWVTGPASAGKSTVMKNIIGRVVGPVALYADGSTTEAGLRQTLNHDARPVIFDEAESEDRNQAQTMQRVLQLARISSSGGEIVKGSVDGQAKTYSIRSCFCFSSINTAVSHYADETRISKLVLRRNETADREAHYEALTRDISTWLTEDYAAKMFARSIANIATLLANARTFTDAADVIVKNRRAADQIGPMLAGLYLCFSTKRITFDAAVAWIKDRQWGDHAALEASNDEHKLLTAIMTYRVRVTTEAGIKDITIGELCLNAEETSGATIYGLSAKDSNLELGRNGMKYDPESRCVIIANKAPALSKMLADTPWAKDWVRPLRSLPGAEAADTKYFSAGLTQKGTKLPISLLKDAEKIVPRQTEFEIPF